MTYKHLLDPPPGSPGWEGHCPPHKYPGKNTHSYLLYKYGECWAFNHWTCQKYDEQLLNGSEKCLDWHYLQLTGEHANWQSEMKGTFSTELSTYGDYKPTTTLTYLEPWEHNPKASWYLDKACGMKWWLCPFWGQMHPNGEPPMKTHLLLTPHGL